MIMRDTVFCAIPADADTDAITASIDEVVAEVQQYVPGYTLRAEPQFDEPRETWNGNARVAVFLEVRGNGDYLPEYAGQPGHHDRGRGPRRRGHRPAPGPRAGDRMTTEPRRRRTGRRRVRITDTTLRDGSHAMAHQFTEEQVRATVHALDAAGVEVIEVTHGDGLGGSSFNYGFSRVDEIAADRAPAVQEATQAKIAVLLVPGIGTMEDLRGRTTPALRWPGSRRTAPRPTSPSSTSALARDLGMETVGFLMMAHRTSPAELARQARIMVDAGAQCVYVRGLGRRAGARRRAGAGPGA